MTTFNCPHCGKSIGLSVIGVQTEVSPPPAQVASSNTSPPPATTGNGKLVTTQQALTSEPKLNASSVINPTIAIVDHFTVKICSFFVLFFFIFLLSLITVIKSYAYSHDY